MNKYVELVDQVYFSVKEMIFNQELLPGQKILQEKLAEELGVSRSPLLKALHKLENELLVESIPRRGMIVKRLDDNEIIEIFQVRSVIEGLSARLASKSANANDIIVLKSKFNPFLGKTKISQKLYEKADREFHSYVMNISKNNIVKRLELLNNINLNAFQVGILRPAKETLPEHFSIIDAIENGDEASAEKLMRQHIDKSRENFENNINR